MTAPLPAAATPSDVTALYRSLLIARRQAQTMQGIERAYRRTPLAELVHLARSGALRTADPDPDPLEQP
jgi:hypothetical protein